MKTKTHYPSYTLTVEDAFHYADSALLQELLDKGLSPDSRLHNGESLLIEALRRGFGHFVDRLKERGVSFDTHSAEGDTAFIVALPHHPIWQLEAWWPTPDVNRPRTDGARPLHIAVEVNNPVLIEWLREQGADLGLRNAQGETPLAYCRRLLAETSDRETRAWLKDCERELTVEAREWNLAAYDRLKPELETAGLLRDTPQRSFLAAIDKQNIDLTRKLLEAGADPNAHEDKWGTKALYLAAESGASPQTEEMVQLLLDHGALPSRASSVDGTPLSAAADEGDGGTVERLLAAGANPYWPDEFGVSLLFYALRGEREGEQHGLALRLLELGVDVEGTNPYSGNSPLEQAVENGDVAFTRLLLERGAHPFSILDEYHDSTTIWTQILSSDGFPEDRPGASEQIFALFQEHFPFLEPL